MSILAIIVAIALGFLAFQLIRGMVKMVALAVIVLFGLFVAHQAGAF